MHASQQQAALKVLASGVLGTTFMTAFSYLISEQKERNFREPQLLALLLYRIIPELNKRYSHIAGWNVHYAVGIGFAMVYRYLWKRRIVKPTVASGLMLGAISGIVGIISWNLTFQLHPSPPGVNRKRYYGHLFVTHLVFGLFAMFGYRLMNNISRKRSLGRTN